MRLLVTGTTMAALLAGAAAAQQAAPPPAIVAPAPSTLFPATQALFDSYVAQGKLPGIVAGFGAGDLPTAFVQAGKINEAGAPADPDSLWRVYSMTKPVTAMAAMILIDEGKMKLDQPISDFIPEFKTMRVQLNENTIESRPATKPITVRNLLTHTAGLGYTIITKGPLLDLYNQKGLVPAQISAQTEVALRKTRPANVQDFAKAVASVPLIADPGTKWSYSIGLDVMVAVVEKAAKMPYDKFVQTRIFDPLKMKSTFWTVPASAAARLSTNYAFLPGSDKYVPFDPAASSAYLTPPTFPYGGAGLVMSSRDYDRFLHMLQNYGELDGVRIMRAETAKLAMSNLLPDGVTFGGVAGGTGGTSGPSMGFGAGGSVVLADGPGTMGAGTYAWGGAAGTKAWVNPVRKFRGNIMVNYFPSEKWPVQADTMKALIADMARLGAK